jgi:hypothetical protein
MYCCKGCILFLVCNPDEKLMGFDGEDCEDFIELNDEDCLDSTYWEEMSYRFYDNDYYDQLSDEDEISDLEYNF